MKNSHILLVVFPAQGHINPSLQFANRLIKIGVKVTFTTSIAGHRLIPETATTSGINFITFSDGYDNGFKIDVDDTNNFISELRTRGSKTIREIITDSASQGRPVTGVVYTLFLPWAALVARELHAPSALLWIQPASVIDIYYYYFNGYDEIFKSKIKDPSCCIELPGLPLLKACDFPSFMFPDDPNKFALPTLKEQLEILDEEEKKPTILVNTFDALESDALRAISKYKMFAVGPLMPPSFLDSRKEKSDYIEFLNSKPESSVIYIAFGSFLPMQDAELEEMARGILATRRPFLWVIRGCDKNETKLVGYIEELKKQGMIVPWCLQLDVLNHPSLGCFVTHCGWNSTIESLTCGVPVVAFPHWMDQATNAKLIEDVWCTGVRVRAREKDGIVESGEVSRCVEMVMGGGDKGNELRKNAKKWKDLAKEALKDGGSVDKNLEEFLHGLHI